MREVSGFLSLTGLSVMLIRTRLERRASSLLLSCVVKCPSNLCTIICCSNTQRSRTSSSCVRSTRVWTRSRSKPLCAVLTWVRSLIVLMRSPDQGSFPSIAAAGGLVCTRLQWRLHHPVAKDTNVDLCLLLLWNYVYFNFSPAPAPPTNRSWFYVVIRGRGLILNFLLYFKSMKEAAAAIEIDWTRSRWSSVLDILSKTLLRLAWISH